MSLLGTATAVFWWCGDNHTILDRFDKGHQPMHFELLLAYFAAGPQDSHSLFAIALHRSRRCFITWEEQVVSDEKQWRWTWHPAQVSPLRISIPMRFKVVAQLALIHAPEPMVAPNSALWSAASLSSASFWRRRKGGKSPRARERHRPRLCPRSSSGTPSSWMWSQFQLTCVYFYSYISFFELFIIFLKSG